MTTTTHLSPGGLAGMMPAPGHMTVPSPRTLSPVRNMSTPVLGMPPPPTVAGLSVSSPMQAPARRAPVTPSMSTGRLLQGAPAPGGSSLQGFGTPGGPGTGGHTSTSMQGFLTPGGLSTPGGAAGTPGKVQQQATTDSPSPGTKALPHQRPPQHSGGSATAAANTPTPRKPAASPGMGSPSSPSFVPSAPANSPAPGSDNSALQAEITRRQAAETRVRELEALVAKLRGRLATLEGRREGSPPHGGGAGSGENGRRHRCETPPSARKGADHSHDHSADAAGEDPIDVAICEYLERNPDFPVSIQKVANNYYVFGDRGTVYVTKRGEHIVVRVGGGFKSLQVFMDERALMVTRDNAAALSDKNKHRSKAPPSPPD